MTNKKIRMYTVLEYGLYFFIILAVSFLFANKAFSQGVTHIEAENAAITGAAVESDGAASNGQYIDFTAAGQTIECSGIQSDGGSSVLTLHSASGRSNGWATAVDVYVNGNLQPTSWFSPTGSYTTFVDENYNINLASGANTIRIESKYDHSQSIDYIEVTNTITIVYYELTVNSGSGDGQYEEGEVISVAADAPPTGQEFDAWAGDIAYLSDAFASSTTLTMPAQDVSISTTYKDIPTGEGPIYQAENASVSGATISGTYVDFTAVGQYIEFNGINHPDGGNVTMVMRYANGREWGSGTDLYVNGNQVGTIWDSPTGGWTVFADKSVNITLNAGNNTIRLVARYDHSPNIDYIDVPGTGSVPPPPTYSLSVSASNGSVAVSPDKAEYDEGESVSLTATPGDGYQFDGWSGDASGIMNPLNVTMDSDKNITANFSEIPAQTFSLTVNSGSGDGDYEEGVVVNVSADAPPSAQEFDAWTGDTGYLTDASASSTTLTMPAQDVSISATYKDIPTGEGPIYQAENATVSGATISGTYVDFTATDQYIEFTGINHPDGGNVTMVMRYANGREWGSGTDLYVNGNQVGTIWDSPTGGWTVFADKSVNITLNAGNNTIRLVARYDHSPNIDYIDVPGTTGSGTTPPPTYSLSVSASNGSVAVSPDKAEYYEGESVSLTATPHSGYQFDGWSGDASGIMNPLNVTMDSDKNITANFSLEQDGLTYNIGMNVGGITDYAESKPFADAMMQHRRWDKIGGGDANLDSDYWPTEDALCLLYHGLNTGNNHGTYTVSYEGQPVTVSCNAASITDVTYDGTTNRTSCKFNITDQNHSYLTLTFTNTNNGVRNVKVMRPLSPGSSQAHPESQVFYEGFKQALAPFSILRTMDFTSTNHNEDQYWSDRTKWTDASQSPPEPAGKDYGWQGRPASWEAVIKLANELNKDIWICIPHMADINYIENVAKLFRDGNEHTAPLNSNLKLYVEYSNEVWNWAGAFSQTPYARDMGNSYGHPINFDGGPSNDNDALRRFYAMRTVQISLIFRQIFGDAQMMTRVRPLIMTQKGFKDITDFAFSFIDRYYGGADSRSDWSNPQPVKYYVYGHSGTTYFSPEKNAGVDINSIWNSNEFDGWGIQYPKEGYVSTWSKTFGLKTMAYEGNVHYTYDNQNTDDVIDQAVLDPRWTDELQEQFEVFAATGGDHWSFFAIEGWMPPTHGDIWATNTDFYQKLVELTNTQKHTVTYGNTAPFSIDGGAVSAITRGWGEPTSGTVTLTANARLYASMYAFHTNSDGTYNVEVEYSSNTNSSLQIMVDGNAIFNQNLASTNGSVAKTNAIDVSLRSNELYALRTACLSGEITIHTVSVGFGQKSKSDKSIMKETINNEILTLYPNPVYNGEFNILTTSDKANIKIFDLSGKKVYQNQLTDNALKISTKSLKKGIYIVKVQTMKDIKNVKLLIE